MAEITQRRNAELAAGDAGDAALAVYAAATGLATAVPLPVIDRILAQVARGSALRRVASRHGVRLTNDARAALTKDRNHDRRGALPLRVVRTLVSRAAAPLRVISRLEDATSAYAAAILLDHYLATADRPARSPLTADEARRVRGAMESAEVRGALSALKAAPGGFGRTVVGAVRAAVEPDVEDRSPLERFVDALLDSAADAPDDVGDRLRAAFDAALADREAR